MSAIGLVAGAVAPVIANGGNWRQVLAAALGALSLALGGAHLLKTRNGEG